MCFLNSMYDATIGHMVRNWVGFRRQLVAGTRQLIREYCFWSLKGEREDESDAPQFKQFGVLPTIDTTLKRQKNILREVGYVPVQDIFWIGSCRFLPSLTRAKVAFLLKTWGSIRRASLVHRSGIAWQTQSCHCR